MGDTDYALYVGGDDGNNDNFRIDCIKFDGSNIKVVASTTLPSMLVEFAMCTVNVNGK